MNYDTCYHCDAYVPFHLRKSIIDERGDEIIIHTEHFFVWARNEVKDQMCFIAQGLKGICIESSRLCKKIKRRLRGEPALSQLKNLFFEVVGWLKGVAVSLKEIVSIHLLDELYRRLNFIGRIFNEKKEVIYFSF